MMSQTPPIHLLDGESSFGGFAELDVGDALALALPVLVDLHALHLRQHHHQLFQAGVSKSSKMDFFIKLIFEV